MVTRFLTRVWLKITKIRVKFFLFVANNKDKLVFELYIYLQFSSLLILIFYAKFELNSLRNNEITMKLLITDIFGCCDKAKVRNDVIFKQWL